MNALNQPVTNPSQPKCPQCGMFHPPVLNGETCPLAPVTDSGGEEINFDSFLKSLKDILVSQIQQKGIQDTKKLFGFVIVEVTKILENYKEE